MGIYGAQLINSPEGPKTRLQKLQRNIPSISTTYSTLQKLHSRKKSYKSYKISQSPILKRHFSPFSPSSLHETQRPVTQRIRPLQQRTMHKSKNPLPSIPLGNFPNKFDILDLSLFLCCNMHSKKKAVIKHQPCTPTTKSVREFP